MKNIYKYSQFNVIAAQQSDKVLIYNTYSLNYRWITESELSDIQNKNNIDLGDVPEYFAHEGFIIPMEIDEIQRLKDDAQENLKQADYLYISIFTTLACNYRCVYCFEKDQLCQTEYMTIETADEIINFIKKQYEKHQFTKPLKIKWFGGEPLLNMKIIRYISKSLIDNNIKFYAKMYTNGRLLTKEIAEELKSLNVIDEVVIPIDGLATTYSKLKKCKKEDFYTVLDNIKECENILKIIIHINVSEASKADVKPLMDLIRNQYDIKARIKIAAIAPQNTQVITNENSIDFKEHQKSIDIINDGPIYIRRRTTGCEARLLNYYVIGTKGELYFCEHLVGQQQYIVGSISNNYEIVDRRNTIWDNDKIIDDCNKCVLLPICLGKCTSQRYIDKIDCQKEQQIESIKQRLCKLAYTKQE